MRILVTGGTGFVGARLVPALVAAGHHVILLARDPARAAGIAVPLSIVTSLDQIGDSEEIDAIVNLAGEWVVGGLWTARRKRLMLRSRLRITRDLARLVERLRRPPQVMVSASAIGFYWLWQDEPLTEATGGRPSFGNRVCGAWEKAARAPVARSVRCVQLRIGRVLGRDGGMLRSLLVPFELGLGGPIGDGRQWTSWIARDDLVRLVMHAIVEPGLSGPVNAVAPGGVRNDAFTACLAGVFGRPAFLRLPAGLVRLGAGELGEELLLGSQQVIPQKLMQSGIRFL
jgi:uncharacterized protein (TIGR01777 family)